MTKTPAEDLVGRVSGDALTLIRHPTPNLITLQPQQSVCAAVVPPPVTVSAHSTMFMSMAVAVSWPGDVLAIYSDQSLKGPY
jgi:hypothetical protein